MPDPAKQPVSVVDVNTDATHIEPGIALCLSGGGYRAMVFHLGALIRLNEVGLLGRLNRISSVSGASIASAQLGLKWLQLRFQGGIAQNLKELVIDPVRRLAEKTIDESSIIWGILTPGVSISDKITAAYKKFLFGDATLQHLPADNEGPRFVINATNVQSGALWRFSRPYMADYKVGRIMNPTTRIAVAVAASCAFPPVLSPLAMTVKPSDFLADPGCPLQKVPFTSQVVLSDGGVYDNLGLETAWKRYRTILVSDAGGKMPPQADPKRDWARHAFRINDIIDNQVRSLRKRQLIDAYDAATDHDGTYWSIRSHTKDYSTTFPLHCPEDRAAELAETPTRLKRLETAYQNRLINWGYAICAMATMTHYPGPIAKPPEFPYAGGI